MKYAHINTAAAAQVLGWYLVRDEQDPDGFDYPNLPPAAELAVMTPEQWDTRMDNPWYDPATQTFGAAPGPSLDDIRSAAYAAIDAAAFLVDRKYLTCGGQQGQVYQQKLDQAHAYKAAGYPALADPLDPASADYAAYGYVRAYRETLRVTNAAATDQAAADAIIATAEQCAIVVGIRREEIRLTQKAKVGIAATEADITALVSDAQAQLGAL